VHGCHSPILTLVAQQHNRKARKMQAEEITASERVRCRTSVSRLCFNRRNGWQQASGYAKFSIGVCPVNLALPWESAYNGNHS